MTTTRNRSQGIAVVTGASSGIGRVYADRLAQRGYDLLLIARRADLLESVAADARTAYGVAAETMIADLGSSAELARLATRLESDDRITMLVNNAGTAALASSFAVPYSTVESILRLNVEALTRLSLAVLPRFKERNDGTIINIGSVMGFHVLPISSTYSGSKGHVTLFTLGLQQELAGTDVRVQLVLPSTTATEIWDVTGIPLNTLDPAIVMSAEDCVDASLAGLDMGETVTIPSLEDAGLWKAFEDLSARMFAEARTRRPASRYKFPVRDAASRVEAKAS